MTSIPLFKLLIKMLERTGSQADTRLFSWWSSLGLTQEWPAPSYRAYSVPETLQVLHTLSLSESVEHPSKVLLSQFSLYTWGNEAQRSQAALPKSHSSQVAEARFKPMYPVPRVHILKHSAVPPLIWARIPAHTGIGYCKGLNEIWSTRLLP